MSELSETGWAPQGSHLYLVETPDDADIWSSYAAPVTLAAPPMAAAKHKEPPRDFALNCPGGVAGSKRDEVNREAPLRNLAARVLGIDTEERTWRVCAKGAQKVDRELSWLGPEWHVLHDVEVKGRGSDIDHVLIGPAGVITLNTKRHPKGKAWVGEWRITVNRQPTDYLRSARSEALHAARVLSAACGHPVPVRAAIVFVDLDDFTVKQMPNDVYITTRRRLLVWLKSLPETTDAETVELIHARARFSTTWQ